MLSLTMLSSMTVRKTWVSETPDVSDNEDDNPRKTVKLGGLNISGSETEHGDLGASRAEKSNSAAAKTGMASSTSKSDRPKKNKDEAHESFHESLSSDTLLLIVPRMHRARQTETDEKPQLIFRKREKYTIVILGGLLGFWLSISSPIYVPVLSRIELEFRVSELDGNITIVVYSIFQGLGPIFFSNIADSTGRRPIVLVCLLVYLCANVAIALNHSFAWLVVLRCIQAFGISSTISLGGGIASDITNRAERASYIGLTTGLALLGQAFGAFIGGMISSAFGWRAIFWFLAILAGATFVVIFLLLPETAAQIVGQKNDRLPRTWKWVTVAPIMRTRMFRSRLARASRKTNETNIPPKSFNLFRPLKLLKLKNVFLVLFPASICYSLWLMMLTSLSHALTKNYGFLLDQVALAYIPSGLGGLAGSVSIGKMLDYSYRKSLRKSQKEGCRFSVLKSRLVVSALPSCICVLSLLLFAWTLQLHGPISLVVVASCLIAFGAMNWLTISSTVAIDANPMEASGACACVNLTRCLCAALFIAVLTQMENMGMGWCYTVMAILCGVSSMCVGYLYLQEGR